MRVQQGARITLTLPSPAQAGEGVLSITLPSPAYAGEGLVNCSCG
jgi:hypothetical protein